MYIFRGREGLDPTLLLLIPGNYEVFSDSETQAEENDKLLLITYKTRKSRAENSELFIFRIRADELCCRRTLHLTIVTPEYLFSYSGTQSEPLIITYSTGKTFVLKLS